MNPLNQKFTLRNPYNLDEADPKNDWGGLGEGIIWQCMDCCGEYTRPEFDLLTSEGNDCINESCLDCSKKPKMMCKKCNKQELDYHSDKECGSCERKNRSDLINVQYSNGSCASILRMGN